MTKEEAVERARALAPFIAERALSAEKARKPDDEVIARLDEAGLFTLLVPKRWGGPELGLDAQFEVVDIVSSACTSTGWITAFYIGHHLFCCRMSERAQEEMFANGPRCLLPATSASFMDVKKVDGGYILNGKGTWGSGIVHGDWAMVAGMTPEGLRSFVIPCEELTYDDVWRMGGMAATGSNDIVAKDVFVPDHRSEMHADVMAGTSEGAKIHDNPIYTMQLMAFIYAEIIGIFTGGLEAAQASFAQGAMPRSLAKTPDGVVDRAQHQIELGKSAAKVEAVRELARSLIRKTDHLIATRNYALEERLKLKAFTGTIIDMTRDALTDMMKNTTAFSYREDVPLQRINRDLNMIGIHAFWDPNVGYEQLGRHLVGRAPNNMLV